MYKERVGVIGVCQKLGYGLLNVSYTPTSVPTIPHNFMSAAFGSNCREKAE
jgi:hypothetical protein